MSNYQLIMENWRDFLKEKNKEDQDALGCDPELTSGCLEEPTPASFPEDGKIASHEEDGDDMPGYLRSDPGWFYKYTPEIDSARNKAVEKRKGRWYWPRFPKEKSERDKWPELWVVRYGAIQGESDEFENAPAICTKETGQAFVKMLQDLTGKIKYPINLKFDKYGHSRPSFDEFGSGTSRSKKKGKEVKGDNQHKAGQAFDILIPEPLQGWANRKKRLLWLQAVIDAASEAGFKRFGFGYQNIHIDTKTPSGGDVFWVYGAGGEAW